MCFHLAKLSSQQQKLTITSQYNLSGITLCRNDIEENCRDAYVDEYEDIVGYYVDEASVEYEDVYEHEDENEHENGNINETDNEYENKLQMHIKMKN